MYLDNYATVDFFNHTNSTTKNTKIDKDYNKVQNYLVQRDNNYTIVVDENFIQMECILIL